MMMPTKYTCVPVLLLAVLSIGCANRALGPYATPGEADRDSLKAQALTQQAAELIDSDPEKAERLLREALTADLYHGPAHNNLGALFLKQGKLYEAANEFEWARKVMPGHPDPRMNLALTLERAGRIDEAMETYGTALEVYPNHLPTIQALARLQLRYDRADDRTAGFLEEIALRGETPQWRDWARQQITRVGGRTLGGGPE
ncbi:MAG: tetratricopeptide repeat protein [Planctomycetota bacterium]|jgi:Tfp pilus assembly protein PilF